MCRLDSNIPDNKFVCVELWLSRIPGSVPAEYGSEPDLQPPDGDQGSRFRRPRIPETPHPIARRTNDHHQTFGLEHALDEERCKRQLKKH